MSEKPRLGESLAHGTIGGYSGHDRGMAARNRVTPFGEIVAIDQRGLFMGNRGSIHRGRTIVRQWQVRRWITCVLEHRGWVAPKWEPGRWTALFFWDEIAVPLPIQARFLQLLL